MLKDFFYDEKTGKLSQLKFWKNIGYAAATVVVLRPGTTAELLLIYMSCVTLDQGLMFYLKRRFADAK